MSRTQPLTLSRRAVLSGAIATTALPAWAQTLPTNPDVVVIGAGAAGLAAARTLIAEGRSVVVVEAAGRVGGRAWTEDVSFGVPFDHGCSWISAADDNPFRAMAETWGFETFNQSNSGEAHYVGDQRAPRERQRQFDRAWGVISSAMTQAAVSGRDVAAASVVPADLDYAGVCQTWMGAMSWGVDFTHLSTLDDYNAADLAPNVIVKEGHGALVARVGADLPIQLNTPATGVDWSGDGVVVKTPAGDIRARAAIVTVSMGVLSHGAIAFTPGLPDWKTQAIDDLPMGLLAKVALQFDGARFGLASNDWLSYWVPDEIPAEACYFLTWPFDTDMMIGFVGGAFGWGLSDAGEDAAIDFALGELEKIFGSSVRAHFVKGKLTGWGSNPFTRGAYAAARPGRYSARAAMARPVGDRVFFAGEAVAGEFTALCGGAYLSGETVARDVSRVLA